MGFFHSSSSSDSRKSKGSFFKLRKHSRTDTDPLTNESSNRRQKAVSDTAIQSHETLGEKLDISINIVNSKVPRAISYHSSMATSMSSSTSHSPVAGSPTEETIGSNTNIDGDVVTQLPMNIRPPSHNNSQAGLAGFSQLRCSMSYKNRTQMESIRAHSSQRHSVLQPRSSLTSSMLRTRTQSSGYTTPERPLHRNISYMDQEDPEPFTTEQMKSPVKPLEQKFSSTNESVEEENITSEGQDKQNETQSQLTEIDVVALQTRRAFHQLALAMVEDDSDSDDEGNDHDEHHTTSFAHNRLESLTSSSSSVSSVGGVVRLGIEEYRKFQFRLRQLEELSAEQSRKQRVMEATIEEEVTKRTQLVVDAMEKKLALYKEEKEKEMEIERRMMEKEREYRFSTATTASMESSARSTTRMSSFAIPNSSSLHENRPSGYPDHSSNANGANSVADKILHPRRSRRRRKEIEELKKLEMEQFRAYLRQAEVRLGTNIACREEDEYEEEDEERRRTLVGELMELGDPSLTEETLLTASHTELLEIICVLRRHVSVQDKQLDQAKVLITAAISAREEAEATAEEAVALTMSLDMRLQEANYRATIGHVPSSSS